MEKGVCDLGQLLGNSLCGSEDWKEGASGNTTGGGPKGQEELGSWVSMLCGGQHIWEEWATFDSGGHRFTLVSRISGRGLRNFMW